MSLEFFLAGCLRGNVLAPRYLMQMNVLAELFWTNPDSGVGNYFHICL
jgi:hypothetical protein